ncbi:hypothetical protein FRX31_020790 [Thalictrum thalictroides]|uniref:Uncharacterized protein n=1 Tax=Thalictrum thalictroides TaxID=46969 RepID=A0A7J6VXR5_THATH|nr:hypothetical protein FRX31_020790 [Thalictrum thalictroides]
MVLRRLLLLHLVNATAKPGLWISWTLLLSVAAQVGWTLLLPGLNTGDAAAKDTAHVAVCLLPKVLDYYSWLLEAAWQVHKCCSKLLHSLPVLPNAA